MTIYVKQLFNICEALYKQIYIEKISITLFAKNICKKNKVLKQKYHPDNLYLLFKICEIHLTHFI